MRKQGKYDKAVTDYTAALQYASQPAKLLINRAYCWAKLAQYRNAVGDYNAAIAAEPDNIHAYHNRC